MISSTERIAIVGMAGRLPGAGADLDRFWANVASATDCASEVPTGRWALPPERSLDPRIANPDTAYSSRGYYLDPFTPDLTGLDVRPEFVAQLDPLFHLVLDAGGRAWHAAQTAAIDRSRVGVVLGNICLPTDRANALCRDYLGHGPMFTRGAQTHPLNRFVAGLPAGVLARALNLGGGSFTLDAACASSLYAVKLAADELLAGRADAMLAGGVNGSDCQYTQMGFAQLRALSASGRCSPFDARADGLMVGGGAVVFVLKRLSDALRQSDHILAVLAGAGLSNDMRGNLLAPAKEGQLRAMRRAYDRAGWQPGDVDLIECHATGTPVGDAVEFESLRELWSESGWDRGRCVIGSVKSTVGHLLTGAGAAALAKVLLAMKAEVLPPQANFDTPAEGLRYADGPFRVSGVPEGWDRRGVGEPRRAAVSGFGFGGVNAHLLIEEWTGVPVRKGPLQGSSLPGLTTVQTKEAAFTPAPAVAPVPVAVVGMAAHFGPWATLRAFQERVFGGDAEPAPKRNGWGLAAEPCPPGFYIEELHFPIDRFRVPPKELEETLPQQLLMLQVAAAALDDCKARPASPDADDPDTGVFIGLGLDLNTTNFHLRWSLLASGECEPGQASPPLTANRTMGALGSIAASRIARAFHLGGPSHTVCSEEASAARAVELAVRALQRNEIHRALVGGVDLAGDPRCVIPGRRDGVTPGEGAAAFVLKRLTDAERDGDRVYAVIRGVGVAGGEPDGIERAMARACSEGAIDPDTIGYLDGPGGPGASPNRPFPLAAGWADRDVGHAGAASAAAGLAKTCLALFQEMIPGVRGNEPRTEPGTGDTAGAALSARLGENLALPTQSRYWLQDRAHGPRRAAVTTAGTDGSCLAIVLEEYAPNAAEDAHTVERAQPLGARPEAVFAIEGASTTELAGGLGQLREFATANAGRHIEALARDWLRKSPPDSARTLAVSLVARTADELTEAITTAIEMVESNLAPPPALRDRVFYAAKPLGPKAKVAFVFPGSGNQFDGMGRDLGSQWPGALRRQQTENELLRGQFAPDLFWDGRTTDATPRDLMFGQVTVGALVSDIVMSLGVQATAMIGLSLGESAGLFGIRAWRSRDEMFRRMRKSTLFNSDLAPPYNAARAHWELSPTEAIDWAAGVIAAPADDVVAALRPGLRAFLLIVNTPTECVIGGMATDVSKLAAAIGKPYLPLTGVTLAHCEAGRPVEIPYRELHTLPVTAPKGVTVYSGVWGRGYPLSESSAADSITAGLLTPIDVPAVVNAAHRDGVRVFIEVGPGSSCTRMIDAILGEKPHLARAAHAPRQDATSQMLRLVANLIAERVPVELAALYGRETTCVGHREPQSDRGPMLVIPVGCVPLTRPEPEPTSAPEPSLGWVESVRPEDLAEAVAAQRLDPNHELEPEPVAVSDSRLSFAPIPVPGSLIAAAADVQTEMIRTQEAFVRVNRRLMESAAGVLQFQTALLQRWVSANPEQANGVSLFPAGGNSEPTPPARPDSAPDHVPRSLTYAQCCTFAVGRIGDVLGPRFAEADSFPTRVRLPDGPLQLVDQVLHIEGEPLSLTHGRVVTTHTVRPDRWYLEAGRIPTAISVEAGQADLFLAGFLGIDIRTRGLAVYRLLDAVVSFHRSLPAIGETVTYDIRIDEFVRMGEAWIFRFRFDGTVNGEPFITMRNGAAGFFTAETLAAGKGIVQTTLDRQELPGTRPADWRDLVPQRNCSLDHEQVEALRRGELATAFGDEFATVARSLPKGGSPLTLPGGMLRLVDRVPRLDPTGGRFGIGFIRAEFDIHPDDWFLTCHFVDDMVMPGTLMYECCLHTLRILLMRMGWIGEAGKVVCEPVPGVNSRLKCRGQVIATTKTVTYEVTVKELGFRPEPYCVADALMYADGKPIVEITGMSLRMTGLTRERLEETWKPVRRDVEPAERSTVNGPLYDSAKILAFSNGKPSEAFGEPYRVFDTDRVIARLPGPPYQFLDRITAVTGEPFAMRGGTACTAEYDIPADAWYFDANRTDSMPFSVLLEIALQPCGWLAAYCGSALTSPEDLSFRNLGGKATQFRAVTRESGTLITTVKLTSVSTSAGMIIQHYEMKVRDHGGPVYEGTTYFGFFSKPALANQVGLREARVPWPSGQEVGRAQRGELPRNSPFPAPMLRMIDRIEAYIPDGGRAGLGLVVGRIAVDPAAWFFQAHFYQDPVWPGSLGLESFLQLLKYVAWKKWGPRHDPSLEAERGLPPTSHAVKGTGGLTSHLHTWTYRGQVLPTDNEVTVVLEVTAADEAARTLTAAGFLTVDGRVIYQMADFTLAWE